MKKILAPIEILVAYICITGFVYKPQLISPVLTNSAATQELSGISGDPVYKRGDIVPHHQVCMVNNMYMGRKQMEVQLNGRLYYGCCEMCKKRIPQEEAVRVAVDPVSNKLVDKAKAIIAITGKEGEVAYFESMTTYRYFFAKQK